MEAPAHEVLSRHTQFALGSDGGTVGALGHVALAGQPTDEDLFVISDGRSFRTFEFDDDSSVSAVDTDATGNVDLTSQPDDGDTVILDDGVNPPVTYEFDNDASVVESATLQQVVIGGSAAVTIASFITKVTTPAAGAVIGMTAAAGAGDSADMTNNLGVGARGNVVIVESTAGVRITATGMTGGTAISIPVAIGVDVRATLTNLSVAINNTLTTRAVLGAAGNDLLVLRNRDDSGAAGNTEIFAQGSNLSAVGFAGGGPKPVGIIFLDGRPFAQIVRGRIANVGDASLTLGVDFSVNNNSTGFDASQTPSPYADQSIRVNAAAVAGGEITVVPGGIEEFLVEIPVAAAPVARYLRFDVTAGSHGTLTLEQEAGGHLLRTREGSA